MLFCRCFMFWHWFVKNALWWNVFCTAVSISFPQERVIFDSLSPSAQSLPGGKVLRQVSCLRVVLYSRHQFSSVAQTCPTLCNPMNRSMPGLPVHHQLLEFTQTHVHWVGDAIQPSHPLSSPSPPAFNLSQHQGVFQWVNSSHEVAKVLEFQLQYQSF